MNLSHKIELINLSETQITYLSKSAGTARFAYNWALDHWDKLYKSGQPVNELILRKMLNSIKKEQYPWMYEVSKCCVQQAIKNLGIAFQNFFNTLSGKNKSKAKYPQYKKKFKRDSFYIDNLQFSILDSEKEVTFIDPTTKQLKTVKKTIQHLKLPNIKETFQLSENIRFKGKIMSVIISRRANRWFASFSVEMNTVMDKEDKQYNEYIPHNPVKNHDRIEKIGIDLGLKSFMVTWDGNKHTSINSVKPYHSLLNKVKRLSRNLSKKTKGSNNYYKSKMKLSELHYRISCIRSDFLHKLTTDLCRTYSVIQIEDLNVKGMSNNKMNIAKSVLDSGFSEFKRQLLYKSELYGNQIVLVDRFFASSKTCSECSAKNEALTLKDRAWTCACGANHDRDENAAKNLFTWCSEKPFVKPVKKVAKKRYQKKVDSNIELKIPLDQGNLKLVERITSV